MKKIPHKHGLYAKKRSRSGRIWSPKKKCISDVRNMFYESTGTQNSTEVFIFKFGLRKSKCRVKLDQMRSIFKHNIILQILPYLAQFCLRIPKCHLFLCVKIRNVKKCVSKSNVIKFTYIFTIAQPKINIFI